MKHIPAYIGALALGFPAYAYAQQLQTVSDVQNLLIKGAKWMYTFFFILATIYILLAAYKYLMAKDDSKQVEKAQAALKNAVIAIVIALISTGVAEIINSALNL